MLTKSLVFAIPQYIYISLTLSLQNGFFANLGLNSEKVKFCNTFTFSVRVKEFLLKDQLRK